ncbi:hypothetical protein C8Q70DRAFT_172085 [Cubamyces menziesii]|nr:hypothetical protein C8Q70DRAFT_172085 [Cubamyces menziesii]
MASWMRRRPERRLPRAMCLVLRVLAQHIDRSSLSLHSPRPTQRSTTTQTRGGKRNRRAHRVRCERAGGGDKSVVWCGLLQLRERQNTRRGYIRANE